MCMRAQVPQEDQGFVSGTGGARGLAHPGNGNFPGVTFRSRNWYWCRKWGPGYIADIPLLKCLSVSSGQSFNLCGHKFGFVTVSHLSKNRRSLWAYSYAHLLLFMMESFSRGKITFVEWSQIFPNLFPMLPVFYQHLERKCKIIKIKFYLFCQKRQDLKWVNVSNHRSRFVQK